MAGKRIRGLTATTTALDTDVLAIDNSTLSEATKITKAEFLAEDRTAIALRELASNKTTDLLTPNNVQFPTTKAVTDILGNTPLATVATTATGAINEIKAEIASISIVNANAEIVEARSSAVKAEVFATLDARIEDIEQEHVSVNSQLTESATYIASGNNIFEPAVQPSALITDAPYFADGVTITSDEMHTLYDLLVTAYPNYITKTLLGTDQSDTYDIFKYVFAPANYEKTMIFTGVTHGNEVSGSLAIYRFLNLLCNNVADYPQLAYLRNKVRIVVVPVVNPWGMNQATRIKYNSRDVDCGQNFDYRWQAGTHMGSAPFTENESIYIRDLLSEYSDSISYLDFHNTLGTCDADYYIGVPKYDNTMANDLLETYRKINNNGARIRVEAAGDSFGAYYAAAIYGMYGAIPEIMDGNFGDMFSSAGITQGVRWFGNIICDTAAKKSKLSTVNKAEPFTVLADYEAAGGDAPNLALGGALTEILQFRHAFDIPCEGILDVTISASILSASGSPTNALAFAITQGAGVGGDGGSTAPESAAETHMLRTTVFFDSPGLRTLTTTDSIRVEPTSDLYGKATIRVYGYTTDGSAQILRFRSQAKFTPSNSATKLTIFSSNTRMANGTDAMQIVSQV